MNKIIEEKLWKKSDPLKQVSKNYADRKKWSAFRVHITRR